MGFAEDVALMQEWLQSGSFGSNGEEIKFLRSLCQKSLERADSSEAERAFSRNDILGTNWRSTLPTKSREKSLKDVADRAMKSYQNGIAAYRQRLMEKGMETILVPKINKEKNERSEEHTSELQSLMSKSY